MRGYVASAEFSFVLGKGVERGVEVLLDGLVRLLFLRRSISTIANAVHRTEMS